MAGIALGITSRPTYDAAEPLLRNKQIEYQRELELKRLAQQAKLAKQQQMMQALGMLNQNMQQQRSQANQREMQQEQIQAQMARDAQQQAAQSQSLLERQFNQMHAQWQQGVDAARKAGFDFDPKHQGQRDQLEKSMLNIDQRVAAGLEDPVAATRAKMALLQQMAVFKPTVQVQDPMDAANARILRRAPDGTRLNPGDPVVPGEQSFIIDNKGVPKAVTPPPAPKQDDLRKEERRLTEKFITETERNLKEAAKNETSMSRKQAETEARKALVPSNEQFERDFGVPHKVLTPSPVPYSRDQAMQLNQARRVLQEYARNPVEPSEAIRQQLPWAQRTVKQLTPLETEYGQQQRDFPNLSRQTAPQPNFAPQQAQPEVAMPPANINGRPLNDFGQYVLSEAGQSINEGNFTQSPVGQRYTEAAGGNAQQAYQQFESDRSAVESLVPKISGDPPSNASPGAKFFNDRGELLTNIPNTRPIPKRSGGGGGGGGGASFLRGMFRTPLLGGSKNKPPPGGAQQPQQPQQQRKGMPLDRMLGSGDGKDRRGNTPPRTLVFLKKGDPNAQKFLDEIVSKLTPEQQKQLFIETVDPALPASATNRMDLVKQHDVRAFPNLVRQEWDGKKYVTADRMVAPQSAAEMGEFMRNGKNPPPPNGNMAHTYVFLDRADKSGAAERWKEISSRMSEVERSNVTVFDFDSSLPDSPTNNKSAAVKLNIDEFPAVVRGEWNGKGYALKAEMQGPKSLDILKDVKSYREFARPDRDRLAEQELDHDIRDVEKFTQQLDENARKTGDPLKGIVGDPIRGVTDPYGQPLDVTERQGLRMQGLLKNAYENWRNNAESFDPDGTPVREPIPKRTPSVMPGPTQAEYQEQLDKANARLLALPRTSRQPASATQSSSGVYTQQNLARDVQGEMLQQGAGNGPAARSPAGLANSAARQQRIDRWIESVNTSKSPGADEKQLAEDLGRFRNQEGSAKSLDATRQMPAVTGVVERTKLMQQIKDSSQRINQFIKQSTQAQQSGQQDRARQEQQRLMAPPAVAPPQIQRQNTPMPMPRPAGPQQMSTLGIQPSRMQQLQQGIATSVMKPGMLNLDTINSGLTAMGGPNPQPYTGGILGGMQKPRTAPSNELGMMFPQAQQLGNQYAPPGGFIGQGGYQGQQDFGGYSPYEQPYDYGYNTPYPYFDGGGYVAPIIELPQASYGLSDQYDSSNGQYFGNQFDSWAGGSDYNTYQGSYPAGDYPEISYGDYS